MGVAEPVTLMLSAVMGLCGLRYSLRWTASAAGKRGPPAALKPYVNCWDSNLTCRWRKGRQRTPRAGPGGGYMGRVRPG